MKHTILKIFALLGFCLALGFSSSAQTADFNPDTLFPLNDIGLNLPVPSTWTYRLVDGVYFAGDDTAIDLASDGDMNTAPTSPVMYIKVIAFSSLGLTDETTTSDFASSWFSRMGLSAFGSFDASVMGHHAITQYGSFGAGESIQTVWTQSSQWLILTLDVPFNAQGYLSTWETLLEDISATDALDLDETYDSGFGFSVDYPSDWTVLGLESQGVFAFLEDGNDSSLVETGNFVTSAPFVLISQSTYSDLQLSSSVRPTDLYTLLMFDTDLPPVTYEGGFYVNEDEGVGISTEMSNGQWRYSVVAIDPDAELVTAYTLYAPSENALESVLPTFLMMLHSAEEP
jgi:hypothetical protein